MTPRARVRTLSAVLAAQFLLTALLLAGRWGGPGPGPAVLVLDVVWLGASLLAALGLVRLLRSVRAQLHQRDQVVAAGASTSHEWVWESDAEGRITFSNEGSFELLGYRPDELIGVPAEEMLYDDASRDSAPTPERAEVAPGWDDLVLDWRHRDGSRIPLQESATSIRDRKGHPVAVRGTRRALPGSEPTAAGLREAAHRVTEVIRGRAVRMAAQPIVSLSSGRVLGVEALARFTDGRSPERWFAEARRSGASLRLDRFTFEAAVPMMDQLPEEVYLSVNASPQLLLDDPFRQGLLDSAVPFDRLVIEITEHARVADYAALNGALRPLRERGVKFAIDDTGAGFASLSHVLQLNPDIIKLDRTLIANLDDDRGWRSVVTSLVLLALDVGATVTGEGAETTTQLDILATLGVDQAQGYQLARPSVDPAEWQDWWDRNWLKGDPSENRPAG